MALYYFDIRKGTDLMQDDEGSEFASQEAAAQGAARSAAELEPTGWRRAISVTSSSRSGMSGTSGSAP